MRMVSAARGTIDSPPIGRLRNVVRVPDDLLPRPASPHPNFSESAADGLPCVRSLSVRSRDDCLTTYHNLGVAITAKVIVLPIVDAVLDDVGSESFHDFLLIDEHVERIGHNEVIRIERGLSSKIPAQKQ